MNIAHWPIQKWIMVTAGLVLVLWSIFLPIWEGFDEPAHFCYIQHLAEYQEIPTPPGGDQTDYCSTQVEESFAQLPLNKTLSLSPQLTDFHYKDYADYWKTIQVTMPPLIPNDVQARASTHQVLDIWQAQHPPFPYLLLTIPYLLTLPFGFFIQILILRLVCVGLTLLGIWITWKCLEQLHLPAAASLFGYVTVTLAPMFFVHFGRISNEPVTFILFSLTWLFILKLLRRAPIHTIHLVLFGLVYGLGFVSKVFFFTALPVILITFIVDFLSCKNHLEQINGLKNYSFFLLSFLTFALPWFIYQLYFSTAPGVGFSIPTLSNFHMNWFGFFREIFLNYTGLFGWSFLRTSPWFYTLHLLFWTMTGLGCIKLRGFELKVAILALLFPLSLLTGMAYYNLKFNALTITGGWYFYSMGAMLATIIALSWNKLLTQRWLLSLSLCVAWGSTTYLLWMIFNLLMPVYYAI